MGCVTVREEEQAALAASRIIGLSDPLVWCKLKVQQLEKYIALITSDQEITLWTLVTDACKIKQYSWK